MDWERQNFSIAQCIFSESTQSNLVSISSASSSGSSTSSTVGIAVGVAVGVVVLIAAAIAAYFLIRRRRRSRQQSQTGAAAKRNRDDPSEKIRQGFAKGELDTGHDNQRYEMAGSDADQAAMAAKHDFPGWVNEKANYPGHREGMFEADGGGGGGEGSAGRAELLGGGGHRGTVRPLHEMHDPSSQPRFELPVEMDSPGELHGSTPGSSAPASPVSPMRHSGAGAGTGPAAGEKRGSAGRGLRSPFSKPTSSPLSGQASSSSSSGPPPHHHHQSSPSAGGEGPSRPTRSSFLGGFSRSVGGNRSSTASRGGEQQQRNAPAASQPPPSSSSVSRPRNNGYGPGNNNSNSASAAAVDASPFSPVSRRGTFERSGTPTATTYSSDHYNYNNSNHPPISPLQSPEADQQSHQQQGGSLWGRLRRS